MKNNLRTWLIATVLIMIAFPWLAVTFAGTAGMAVCFILFFAINPIYAVVSGVYAGFNIKKLWMLPIMISVMFVLGTWLFFDMGETAFLLYGGVYLVIGIIAMLLSSLIRSKRPCLRICRHGE